jgi:galactokinase
VYGARLTGGGFGGAVVMLTTRADAPDAAERILSQYVTSVGRQGAILLPWPRPGSKEDK